MDYSSLPHRIFAAARPILPVRRRRGIVRSIFLRKFGLSGAELVRLKKRKGA